MSSSPAAKPAKKTKKATKKSGAAKGKKEDKKLVETEIMGVMEEAQVEEDWRHMTKPILMKHERTRILATRVAQLQNRAPPNLTSQEIQKYKVALNPLALAKLELALRRTPMVVRRTLPGMGPDGKPRTIDIPIQELD
jgi:DNA-directed RNA polymerase subunit K/omega